MNDNLLTTLKALTDDERAEARERAEHITIRNHGKEPTPDQFKRFNISDYPQSVVVGVAVLIMLVLFAAANVSVFRVFTAGRNHYLETVSVGWQASVVGAAAFVLAEFTVVVSVLAMRVFFDGERYRYTLIIPIVMGLLMAFVGNWTVARPATAWGWLETIVPPSAVLFMSIISEHLVLHTIKQRHASNKAYLEAFNAWKIDTSEPDKMPGYTRAYAIALKEKIIDVNKRGGGETANARRALMQRMAPQDWRIPVQREFDADGAFDDLLVNPTQPPTVAASPQRLGFAQMQSPPMNNKRTGS